MRIVRLCGVVCLLLLGALCQAVTPSEAELKTASDWVTTSFGDGAAARLPFSFRYGGVAMGELGLKWTRTRTDEHGRTRTVISSVDAATGLKIECEAIAYRDVPAVEWVIRFTNTGTKDTPILDEIYSIDAALLTGNDAATVLHSAEGSRAVASDFAPQEATLAAGSKRGFAPNGGRSSDGVMPFFNLARGDAGVMIGIGWTGQWKASFEDAAAQGVQVKAGLERAHFVLHPGESVRMPSVLLVFWSGDTWLRGQNLLRTVLREHYSPTVRGKAAVPPIAASPHGIIAFNDTTEQNLIEAIDGIMARKLPIDTYWLDAGWNVKGFATGQGNWDPDPVRFPNGLKPVSDAAHRHGLKFLMWFEPERVMRGTTLHEAHPEWLLAPRDLPGELMYHEKDGFFLLDFGNPDALAYAKSETIRMIREFGVDTYRQDFNMFPLYYWRNEEPADRVGIREIKHIEGLYDFYDTLLATFPDLIIDNCASGGRRIDFEILRRCFPLTRSDLFWEPVPQEAMTYGLSLWIPYNGVGAVTHDPYAIQTGLGSSFVFALDHHADDDATWARTNQLIERYKLARPLFTMDFYPLTPYGREENAWMAWQLHDESTGRGFVQIFRRKDAPQPMPTIELKRIDPSKTYVFESVNTGKRTEGRGIDTSEMPAPSGDLWMYFEKQ